MRLIPAIDIRSGLAVRLLRGDFADETVYGDPVEEARSYVEHGATMLHIVDLDAAREGHSDNTAIVHEIIEHAGVPVQVGGGVRDEVRAKSLFDVGAARVVLGTAVVEDPDLVENLAHRYEGQIVLGLDYREVTSPTGLKRELAVRGWEERSGLELEEVLERFGGIDLGAVVVTGIAHDGTMRGPDLAGCAFALEHSPWPVIASGGIATTTDLGALSSLQINGRALEGAIVGRALLSGAISMEEALAACAP